jgi:glutamyl-tRNA reductase
LLRKEEVEDLALKYLQAHDPDLAAKTVMVLGSGQIGQGLVNECAAAFGKVIWCYHINRPGISNDWKNKVGLCTFNDFKDRLEEADVIISATEAPGHILHQGHAPFFNQQKPVCLIDLGMPRNIEPALDGLSPELRVVDLDGLKYWHRRETADMDELLNRCHHIIGDHQEQYVRIIKSFQGENVQ